MGVNLEAIEDTQTAVEAEIKASTMALLGKTVFETLAIDNDLLMNSKEAQELLRNPLTRLPDGQTVPDR